jgi:Kef-type K+ transport system membrane component KefB
MSSMPAGRAWVPAFAYAVMLGVAIGLFLLIRQVGEGLTAPPAPPEAPPALGQHGGGRVDVVVHVLTTLAAVIALGYVLGQLFRYLGQPPVIGEVVAGILLGPSLLGAISPDAMHWLIPGPDTDPSGKVVGALQAIAQLGVVLYMFLVGLDLNAGKLRHQAHTAIAVSHASIVLPFVLGAALALWLYPILSHAGVPFTSFALFLGVAMSITAFPVLARILTDRRLDRTEVGVIALSCAATDDVTAWCLLALVVGVARAQVGGALLVMAGAMCFIAVMFLLVRPVVAKLVQRYETGRMPGYVLPGLFVAILVSALATEAIGVHAVFGAFLLGVVVPHDSRVGREFTRKVRDVVTVLLLPAFFAVTGLNTRIGLLNFSTHGLICLAIILVATAGKFGGSLIAARLTGQSWRTATALGALMNTRGLMGLIVLNVGLDLGVISPTLFALMVLMALVTTMATAPVLAWLVPSPAEEPQPVGHEVGSGELSGARVS